MNGDNMGEEQIARNMFKDSQRWRHGAQHGFPMKGGMGMQYGIPAAEPTWVAWTPDGKPAFGASCDEAMDSAMKGGMPMPKMPSMPPPGPVGGMMPTMGGGEEI